MFGIPDLDAAVMLDVASLDFSRSLDAESDLRGLLAMHHQSNTLEVQQQVDDIFLYTFQGAVFVLDAIDLHLDDSATRHRGKENAAQSIPQSVTKAPFEGFEYHFGPVGGQQCHVNGSRGKKFCR